MIYYNFFLANNIELPITTKELKDIATSAIIGCIIPENAKGMAITL